MDRVYHYTEAGRNLQSTYQRKLSDVKIGDSITDNMSYADIALLSIRDTFPTRLNGLMQYFSTGSFASPKYSRARVLVIRFHNASLPRDHLFVKSLIFGFQGFVLRP